MIQFFPSFVQLFSVGCGQIAHKSAASAKSKVDTLDNFIVFDYRAGTVSTTARQEKEKD